MKVLSLLNSFTTLDHMQLNARRGVCGGRETPSRRVAMSGGSFEGDPVGTNGG